MIETLTPEEYARASRVVRSEIRRFYRLWGAAATIYEHDDLLQIGLLACLQCDGPDKLKRIAVRRDFFDLVRTSWVRKHKGLRMGLIPHYNAALGYAPLKPITGGYETLSEPEAIVDLERRLTKLERRAPKMVQAIEEYAYSGDIAAVIGQRLGVTKANVDSQLYRFREAVRA